MACTHLSNNLRFACFKEESVPGTAEWSLAGTYPADADFNNRIYGIEVSPNIEFDEEAGNVAMGTHGELEDLVGGQMCDISFNLPLTWGGAVGTAPKWSKILQGCGIAETAYGAVGIGFQPIKSMDCNTLTIAVFDIQIGSTPSAVGYLFSGCIGDGEIKADGLGKAWTASLKFTGKFIDVLDIANANIPEMTGASTEVAEKLLSNTCSIGGVTQYISSFSLAFGNEIQPVINQADSTGYKHFYIANRKPRFSVNPLAFLVATDDVLGRVVGEDNDAIQIATPSSHFTLDIPRAQCLNPALASREGIINWDNTYKCLRNHNGAAAANAAIPDECTWELLQGARA